jgi:hypothetical protein
MTKVRDVITDANLTPSSFNPERITGDFGDEGTTLEGVEAGEEARVHGGFLSAAGL